MGLIPSIEAYAKRKHAVPKSVAYPRDYRSRYADLMDQPFRDQLRAMRAFADLTALTAAKEIAHRAGRQQVTLRDPLAGIRREPDKLAARLLREYISDPS
jgi:hypothetical protein